MQKFTFEVQENEVGVRLDKFLSEKLSQFTRNKIQAAIDEKLVLNSQNLPFKNAAQKVKLGEKISVDFPEIKPFELKAKEIAFEIIFEDDDLILINKPANLTVHPGAGNSEDTLVNALLFTHQNNLSQINKDFRPGIVHRLDKDTSGLMLVAKNDFTHAVLSENLKNREINRSYLAFIYGVLTPKNGKIEKNIARSRINRLKMSVVKGVGRGAITNYKTLETYQNDFASLIECNLETGRTHQIRLHLESVKHSVIGDQTYNSCKKSFAKDFDLEAKNLIANFPRQALHSYKIAFTHPRSKKEMHFEIDLPDDLKNLKKCLKAK
jgi:23S rRNA pseudouridine1911/1915/1917 synthase